MGGDTDTLSTRVETVERQLATFVPRIVSEDAAIGRICKRLEIVENRLAGVSSKPPATANDVVSLADRLETLEASKRSPGLGAVGSSALTAPADASREGTDRPPLAA